MDCNLKRSHQNEGFNMSMVSLVNARKRQNCSQKTHVHTYGETMSDHNYQHQLQVGSDHNNCIVNKLQNKPIKREKKTQQKRVEMNRIRAKDNRKRKKCMLEDMKEIISRLQTENYQLQLHNKIQQEEIALHRREVSRVLESNHNVSIRS